MIMKCQKPFKSLDSVEFTTKNETEFIEQFILKFFLNNAWVSLELSL